MVYNELFPYVVLLAAVKSYAKKDMKKISKKLKKSIDKGEMI
jgi:hypothetical protein